ncbi:uncharacterized protein LOC129218968 [Uloborus diversus]|uniref:uncharacterized protein LOC129218968 n=1 Tax=Uloborus diversus TaxID=327109 RepID=UPI0024096070|nr:uncharacterized protein LOC129218968 [Uloborus diversus]
MEVFPPDDPQPEEVGNAPTQLEQMKAWDDFTKLEKVLQAACENNDVHSSVIETSSIPASEINDETSLIKSDIKRKWEEEIVDPLESNSHKLKRINDLVLTSEVTIELVDPKHEKCDNAPVSNLLTDIVKSETEPKYDEYAFSLQPDNAQIDSKNSLEFIKIEPKSGTNLSRDLIQIHDIKNNIEESKANIFSDGGKDTMAEDDSHLKLETAQDVKSEKSCTEKTIKNETNFCLAENALVKSEDRERFKLPESESMLTDSSSHTSDVSNNLVGCCLSDDEDKISNHDNGNANCTDSLEKKKDKKEKKEELSDKCPKKEDKLLKKKKFERCNIRDIKLEDELDAVTLSAQKEEQERIRRLQEAQMRALQERLQQIEVEKEALTQLFSQPPTDASNLFDSTSFSESELSSDEKKTVVKRENDVVLVESSEEDKAKLQTVIQAPTEDNIIDISSSSSGNESDSEDSEKKDDDIMVLSDEGEVEADGTAEDPNNSGAHTNDCFNLPDEEGRVLVNVGHPPEDPDIFLAPQIAKVIKPHQIGGIRFLYDNVVENLDRYKSSSGFGCILAHSMGLGKTVQVVSFVDVFLRHTPATLVLCIVPINTIQNWKAEFDMWVPASNCVEDSQVLSGEIRPRDYNVYTLNENFKTMAARAALIAEWRKQGGVLLMGYEMYRMLALRKMPKMPIKKSKRLKKQELPIEPETNEQIKKHMDEMYEHIVIPGPDLVICDEGHRIKNSLASTSMALKSIKTRRRVVLTGYPLQNNLLEYWCMVDFVRPNYLGSRAEFCNMFERPISNGQCIDSTPRDRQLMRFRSHVLHSLLVGFVQRRGHSVLRAVLPKKEEHVLLIRMTPIQRQLYKCFVKDLLYVQQATNPLKLFAVCCKIWNHPDILYKLLQEKKAQEDIDLDIDITVASSPALSGVNCSLRKRGVGQNKTKMMQRPLKSLPKLLKVQPNLNMTADSIKSEVVDCSQGSLQQMSDDVKFNSLDVCKNNYAMKSQITPGHKDFCQEGSQQTFLNQFSKNTLPQPFCQTNYPHSSGKAYVSNPQNTNSYIQQSNIVSSRQFSTQTSQQPLSQAQYPPPSLLQTSFEQSQNQYPLVQSQFSNETNELDKINYPSSQPNFPTKAMQSFPSQSENNSHYSQQSETHKQFPQSLSQFSSQPDDNQDINYPSSPQSSNQKFLKSSSHSHVSTPQQTYGTQSEQQYSQQAYPSTSKQFGEEQSLQFSQQSLTSGSTSHNSQQVPYPQMANQSPIASDRSSDHTLSSDSVYQPTLQHSQFPVSHPPQSYSESSPPLSQQQFSQQASFPQHPSSQQTSQQPTSQSSAVQPQFSQSSTNQQMYSQQYGQPSPEFSQTSSPQFQQQNLQSFPISQNIQPQFASNTQSYSETSPNYPRQSSPSSVSQQTFSQSFLQGSSEYSQQSSHQFSQQSSTSQTFSNSSLQHFNQQTIQTGKYVGNTDQQNSFPSQAPTDGHLQFSRSPQSSGQKQVSDSSVVGGNKQQIFSQATYPSASQQSSDSQYPQIGQNPGFDSQTSQSNAFPQTPGNSTQYASQSSEQFSQQASNSNQFHQQANNQTPKYSQQTLQCSHQPASQQYTQQVNQSPNYSQQPAQNSQTFPQQTVSAQFASSPPKSPFKQSNQSQISVPSSPTCYQQVSQASAPQQPTQNISQFSQVTSFPQQSSQVQSFSAHGSQYHQQSVQSSQQFNHTTSQSPQLYPQHPAQSPQQFNQQSNQHSHYNSQVSPTARSPQNFSQQSNQAQEFTQQPNQSSGQVHNNQQSHSPQQKAVPPFNASQQNSSQQFSQQQSQSSEFNHLENLNAQHGNQISPSAIHINQSPNQSSQQFNQQENQASQICNQQAVQNSQHFSQQTNQGSQIYTQQTSQSPQQFNQPTNQISPHVNQQANQQYASNNQTSQNCNEQTNLNQPYNISANQTNQMYSSSHQTYNQQVEPSQTYVQPSGQSDQQYANNSQHSQQFNQHSNQTSPQYTQKVPSNSQSYTQVQCQSSQQYSQQPSQSPQQFNQQPVQSPQFTQPVQSPLQYSQQPAQSPKQYSQQATQSPQQYPQQPAQSPQQFPQQSAQSPQQFPQPPAQSPQQFSQQPAQSPQQFPQQPTQPPQQFPQQPAQSTQQFPQQPAQSTQQFPQQPAQSPQQFPQQPAQSPQQFTQQPVPSPQQFSQQPLQSPQQFSQQTVQSLQHFTQPAQSPQHFTQPAQSPQQFCQQQIPSPQQFSQLTSPSPQQFSQPTTPSPQQFSQPTTPSQQFSQPAAPSPQQFSQQSVNSPQQFTQQATQAPQFNQQSIPSSQQFSQSACSPQQFSQQSSQSVSTPQFPHQSTPPTTTQSFSQLANSPYKQPIRSGQTASFSVPQQQSVQSSQYSNSFSQPVNQASVKGSFQAEYQNQLLSNSPTTQTQGLVSQNSKSTQRGSKSKQGRAKTLGPPLLPQSNVQHSVKQPPSFSVQAFQNGNSAANVSQKMGHSPKQFQNSTKSTFQPLNASLSNQQNYSIQHIKQDSAGVYSSKCSKAVLQPMNCQGVTHDAVGVQQQQMQPNQLKTESSVMDSDQQSNSAETAVAPFRERIDSSINYEWAVPIMKDYVLGVLENSHKMMVLFVIIAETLNMGDKLLVFSQSLSTLDLLEHFLSKIQIPKKIEDPDHMGNETWCRNKNYFRLDGSTSAQEREKLINEFNRNDNVSLFLLSTRAGCLGINLVGANRIVVMDASWNPCHDAQAVCRIYRYGQKKQCHIYRLVTDNSLEKRIYDRQVNKQGMSDRVVDELNPESNFTWKDVTTLIQDDEDDGPVSELSKFAASYSDKVLKYLVSEMSPSLSKEPFEHESLLLDRKDLKLTKQEKRLAKQSYEMAKRANMINIRTTYTYLPAGAAGGGQFIINNKQCQWVGGTTIRVLPNQSSGGGALRSGTTATPITASQSLMSSLFKQGVMVQKLTMPSNVSIPVLTPGAPPVVIPAGQDVLVLRTPKGVYLRLPDGRIIAVQLPPSLLAKTQFRPNVVTHFRPAAPKESCSQKHF